MGQETSSSGELVVDSAAASNDVSVVRGMRRLLVTAVLASLICSWVILASKGGCYETGVCVDMQLRVSPVLFFGFAVIVFLALGRIIKRNLDPFAATRVLDRAGLVVKIVASWRSSSRTRGSGPSRWMTSPPAAASSSLRSCSGASR